MCIVEINLQITKKGKSIQWFTHIYDAYVSQIIGTTHEICESYYPYNRWIMLHLLNINHITLTKCDSCYLDNMWIMLPWQNVLWIMLLWQNMKYVTVARYESCVLCQQCCWCLWILHSSIDPSVFSNVYMSPIHIFQWNPTFIHTYQFYTL